VPVTPFHFGPGLLLKAASPRRLSFTAFAFANCVIDCETAWHALRHELPYHGPLHTMVVATPVGLVAGALLGAALGRLFPRTAETHPLLRAEATALGGAIGGALGGATHPLIDGLMHRDVFPFWPFVAGNPLLGLVSRPSIYVGCVLCGLVGALLLWRAGRREKVVSA